MLVFLVPDSCMFSVPARKFSLKGRSGTVLQLGQSAATDPQLWKAESSVAGLAELYRKANGIEPRASDAAEWMKRMTH